jgi:GH15 family glucan-1,4-alpha-glucosidase
MLVTLSGRGEVERLFWPNIDWGQHLGELRLGIATIGRTAWLDESQWEHRQRYLEDTNIVETHAESSSLAASIVDFVDPERDVLYREITTTAKDARLVIYVRPEIDESVSYGAVYVDQATGALVFYRRGRAIAIGISPRPRSRAGRFDSVREHSLALSDAADGVVGEGPLEYGRVDGVLAAAMNDGRALCAVACATAPAAAIELVAVALADGAGGARKRREAADAATLATASMTGVSDDCRRLYRRSLLVFELVSDRETGAVIAAPEMDGDFDRSGGYGFAWGRDMAYAVLAYIASGQHSLARRGIRWLLRAQSKEGLWLHRHCSDGSLAPSWGLHQIDETGAILFAFEAAARVFPDLARDPALWVSTRAAAEFLCAFRDEETGLPLPSVDLWEERSSTHAYSAAAVFAGLRAAAHAANRHGLLAQSTRYEAVAADMRRGLDEYLWADGRYQRSYPAEAVVGNTVGNLLSYPGDIAESAKPSCRADDSALDASLLGLAWPFGIVDPASSRMRRTASAIEKRLATDDGGLRRYENDTYAGGNVWILTTLWLALWYRQIGDLEGHRRCLRFVVDRQTHMGLLPEQVARDGSPSWVVPLTWSHAMFVLATRPELDLIKSFAEQASPTPG